MNILRRLPLSRLLLLCGLVVAIGISATALASALGSGPVPAPKPLAVAVHDALTAPPVAGVSANVQLTDRLLEGANLAGGDGGQAGQLSSNPLISGASGRLWITKDGRARLELQAEKGDTQVIYDGHTVELYDASTNTLYRYTPPAAKSDTGDAAHGSDASHEAPSLAKIEEAISHLQQHADVSAATPTDIAGQAAYTVRLSPKETGSLLGGVELSWDAVHGVPLRAAVYSTTSSAPVVELSASEVSYGPIDSSVFDFTPPAGAKVQEVSSSSQQSSSSTSESGDAQAHPKVTTRGHGPSTIAIVEGKASSGKQHPLLPEGLPQVKINTISASELATQLGTVLGFERSGVRYLLLGSVAPASLEAVARGL